jgi:predicted regulator of Ras-like GTPase activity (Roadblock/LC7/MglB family)
MPLVFDEDIRYKVRSINRLRTPIRCDTHIFREVFQVSYTLGQKQLDSLDEILQTDLVDIGVHCVFLIDMSGNIIASLDDGENKHDIYSLAALAAGNFGAVSAMAKIVGEGEFSLLFHKGKKENIHFSKVLTEFLLITLFGNDLSLGFLRLKVAESVEKIKKILEPIHTP